MQAAGQAGGGWSPGHSPSVIFSMVDARSPSESCRAKTRSTSAQSGKSSFRVLNWDEYCFLSSPSSPWSAHVSTAASPFVCLVGRGPREPWAPPPLPPRAVLLPRAGRDCMSDMWCGVCVSLCKSGRGREGVRVGDDVVREWVEGALKEAANAWRAGGRNRQARGFRAESSLRVRGWHAR